MQGGALALIGAATAPIAIAQGAVFVGTRLSSATSLGADIEAYGATLGDLYIHYGKRKIITLLNRGYKAIPQKYRLELLKRNINVPSVLRRQFTKFDDIITTENIYEAGDFITRKLMGALKGL